MNICICDDNPSISGIIKQIIEENCIFPELNITIYNNPESLLKDIQNNRQPNADLILMDIQLGELSGITYASKIQSINQHIRIIFVTGFENRYSQLIFDNVSPSGFIVKPINPKILVQNINRIYFEIRESEEKINIKTSVGEISVSANQLLYIESYKRTLIYHIHNDTFNKYDKLNNIEKELPPYFIRCHRSYIINPNFVILMGKNFFEMSNGEKIPISKTYKESSREKYFKHKGIILMHHS